MSDNSPRPGTASSLGDADPFAAPTPTPRVRDITHDTYAADGSGAPVDKSEPFPCPCSCACGNNTEKTVAQITSPSAARYLRCEPCAQDSHFGPQWNPAPGHSIGLGPDDRVVVGDRGTSVTIRKYVPDPIDLEWERQAVEDLATERRNGARERWLMSLPERWQLPYDDGEELVREVEDRLTRLKSGNSVGTSLICFGPFGSGKTWVAYTYARAAVDRRLLWPKEIVIGTEAEIVEPLASAAAWDIAARMDDLLKPTLKMLMIDDVGTFSAYRNAEQRFAAFGKIVDWMYVHKRALVITTNKSLGTGGELEQWIGAPAYERLKSMAGQHQVYRDENKRGEMTAQWESEYQQMRAERGLD